MRNRTLIRDMYTGFCERIARLWSRHTFFARCRSPIAVIRERIVRRWVGIGLVPALLALFFLHLVFFPIPDRDFTEKHDSWRIYSNDGRVLREAVNKYGSRERWTSLDKISDIAKKATIAVEDERFFSHGGCDWLALARALVQNLASGESVSGASTITMQLARLMYDLPHSMQGKLAQIYTATRIERSASKDTILANYLNRSPYGAGTVGLQAASYRYFGKPNSLLSVAETALLVGLPNAPSKYNPLVNPVLARKRQEFVLSVMLSAGIINGREHDLAIAEPLVYAPEPEKPVAMHFTDYVMSSHPEPGDVHTTIDLDLNTRVEEILREHVKDLESGGLTNAAAVILDNNTGAILSMVGSADYWDGEDGAVNGAVSLRQPGSALKPFAYALAFEKGFTPATIIPDIETTYVDKRGDIYTPANYTDKFYGPVLLSEALGRSLNVPAIRLVDGIGVDLFLGKLRDAGFASLDKSGDHYGLGLILGNGEVTLIELASGYAMLARNGMTCRPEAITSKLGAAGGKSIYTKETCFLVTEILTNELLRMRAFGAVNPLLLDFPIAIKTGTSSNWRDNWVVGYTKEITIAVWGGDFGGTPMNQMSGAIGCGPLFRKIAELAIAHLGIRPVAPAPPPGVEQIVVCKLSGLTPMEYCADYTACYVLAENGARPSCDVHRKVLIDKRNGLLAGKGCPPAYTEERVCMFLDPGYAGWQADNGYAPPPSAYSPLCMPEKIDVKTLVVSSPGEGDVYLVEPGYDPSKQTLELAGGVDPPVQTVEWLVDGRVVATTGWPYTASWRLERGKHVAYMRSAEKKSKAVRFEVR